VLQDVSQLTLTSHKHVNEIFSPSPLHLLSRVDDLLVPWMGEMRRDERKPRSLVFGRMFIGSHRCSVTYSGSLYHAVLLRTRRSAVLFANDQRKTTTTIPWTRLFGNGARGHSTSKLPARERLVEDYRPMDLYGPTLLLGRPRCEGLASLLLRRLLAMLLCFQA